MEHKEFSANIERAFHSETVGAIWSVIFDYAKELAIPMWELNTSFCSNVGRRRKFTYVAKGDWKEFPKLTDDEFKERVKKYCQLGKGRRCIWVVSTFFGDYSIRIYNGTECECAINTNNGVQQELKSLVNQYHSM